MGLLFVLPPAHGLSIFNWTEVIPLTSRTLRACDIWSRNPAVASATGRRGEVEAPDPLISTAEGRTALLRDVKTKKGKPDAKLQVCP